MSTSPTPGHLYVVAAPSGTGKTSLVRALMAARPHLKFSVSYTTRPRRPNEVDGRDYHFVDRTTFEAMVERGELLEWARVFDNYYGTGLQVVQQALETLRWEGVAAQARDLAQRLNRSDLAVRWGALSQAPPR